MLGRLAALPAGRAGKLIVLVLWLAVLAVAFVPASKFESVQRNESTSFLPGDAESTVALEAVEEFRAAAAEPVDAVVVYRRAGGLTEGDQAAIAANRASLNEDRPTATGVTPEPILSEDGTTALLVPTVTVPEGESDLLLEAVEQIRDRTSDVPDGLETAVTGGAGFSADAITIFEDINSTLLLATAAIVFVLLVLIYRSPIFWVLPLLAVGFAEITVRALGFLLADAGVVINGQTAGILLVLVFGVGTDYALLLVSRYREELRRHADRHDAMAIALRRAGPALIASGFTNVCALLVLALAAVNGTAGLGPIGAIGIAVALATMLTALPALLVLTGRWVFWPFVPRFRPEDGTTPEERGLWRGLGERIARRPRPIWIATLVALAVMTIGLSGFSLGLNQSNGFRGDVESVEGQELLAAAFPAGASAPTDVVVRDPADVPAVSRAVEAVFGVSAAMPVAEGSNGVLLAVTLVPEPYSSEAFDLVPDLREAATGAANGEVLVGGPSAVEHDLREAGARDLVLLPPIVLLVIVVIIGLLLRSVVAPLLLVGTVILSYLAALGASTVVFDVIFDFPGEDIFLPLFGFIFLVAVGVDYNIFLMARVREEALTHGTRAGMVRGLAATGAVITSAGVVLAGTFAVLGVLPLIALTEIGFLVAFGILLDTILVRSVLVPALVTELGGRIWWPSRLDRAPAGSSGRVADPGEDQSISS